MIENREKAGKKIADALRDQRIAPEAVMALPPGGLPIGIPLAEDLGLSLDVVVGHPLETLYRPVTDFGGISTDGTIWLETDVMEEEKITEEHFHMARDRALAFARLKLEKYGGPGDTEVKGKDVVVVGDGTDPVSVVLACTGNLMKSAARNVYVAMPVISSGDQERLSRVVDDIITLERTHLPASRCYESFRMISDDEAARQFQGRSVSRA